MSTSAPLNQHHPTYFARSAARVKFSLFPNPPTIALLFCVSCRRGRRSPRSFNSLLRSLSCCLFLHVLYVADRRFCLMLAVI